jgi:hypothetical protein
MNMLANLHAELGQALNEGTSQYGLIQKPKKPAGLQYLFVNRDEDLLVHKLNADSKPVYVSNDLAIRGALVEIKVFEKKATKDKYKDTIKLDLFFATRDGQRFAVRTGYESTFGKGAIYALNAFSPQELKDIVLGWKPGDDEDKKTVYAEVTLPDGSWKQANRQMPLDQATDELVAKLSGASVSLPKQQSSPTPKAPSVRKAAMEPEPESLVVDDDYANIPF